MELIFDISKKGRKGSTLPALDVPESSAIPKEMLRAAPGELPEVTEQDAVRHFTKLSTRNVGVDTQFYPLGSCTMKYNPKINEKVASLSGFSELHPLWPQLRHGGAMSQGALEVLYETERMLSDILGFSQCTMQPLAGAHGELTGIMMIAAYHNARRDKRRKVMLIPDSAHGTNPASASVAGFECRTLPTDERGNVNMAALREELGPEVAGLMLTAPNTLGLFDSNVREICRLVHEVGGLAYCDGANFNALIGRVRPGDLGFDVMHINLHKTFSTPHGGGGPGSGPVAVSENLVPYLPISRVVRYEDGMFGLRYDFPESIGYIAPFYGNFGIILRAYAYLLTVGKEGLVRISQNAVLNANYIRTKLAPYYKQAYDRFCMHECVLTAEVHAEKGVKAIDIAKALLDRGFHPPTMYFPLIVHECLMIEPTETESKETLDKFIEAMIEIAKEVDTNPEALRNAPISTPVHRLDEALAARKLNLRV
ncbi:MAG TPA: aminomethyl-transferring glycine dehydrogenase subunit GcvPB [Lentisphaeria bacterium]|nr:MAG: glycine dehydrogenase (aminomethyl-transferring) [Lentisphaerae bacterium GWF2_38_69]HBM15244.1 aminomethyl-transferring glycine dehydrogenase subunit GcvPB [Lentisphaeria bacterium]